MWNLLRLKVHDLGVPHPIALGGATKHPTLPYPTRHPKTLNHTQGRDAGGNLLDRCCIIWKGAKWKFRLSNHQKEKNQWQQTMKSVWRQINSTPP